jgi:lysophospholipase L1-like esterase
VEESRKDLNLQWVNHAVSYQSSTDVLRQASRTILAEEADWYICAVGMFDCARLDVSPDRPMVALAESWQSLAAIEDVIDKVSENPAIWILPHPVDEQMQEGFDFFDLEIKNEDISAYREVMSGRKGFLIESMHSIQEAEKGEWYYKPDGIHLSDAGHATLVKEILLGIEYHSKILNKN